MAKIMKIDEMANSHKSVLTKFAYKKYLNVPGMNEDIHDWYMKEFPDDDMGEDIKNITFGELLEQFCKHPENIYDTIGVYDSVIRERFFEQLSDMCNLDYDNFYNHWLYNIK